jgi:diphosphomevalonate decarboxylase
VITAVACSNIALVKYWGKRDAALNLPARGSLSLTLAALRTVTRVELAEVDSFALAGVEQTGAALAKLGQFLDVVRAMSGRRQGARVESANDFPTGSGLASSASAFAALALAASHAYGLPLLPEELSVLARRGSGSAARSIFGGLVRMHAGTRADGSDAHATPIDATWDLRMVVGVALGGKAKDVSSRSGMDHTAATSPLYPAWLDCVDADLAAAEQAIAARDLERLGDLAEASALAMHASAFAARPGVIYFRGVTLEAIHAVRALRQAGTPAWATIDAGPHVKVLTTPEHVARVVETLVQIPGITSTIVSAPGPGAHLIE